MGCSVLRRRRAAAATYDKVTAAALPGAAWDTIPAARRTMTYCEIYFILYDINTVTSHVSTEIFSFSLDIDTVICLLYVQKVCNICSILAHHSVKYVDIFFLLMSSPQHFIFLSTV